MADWHGLKLSEAHHKVRRLDYLKRKSEKIPKKHEYREELLQLLKEGYLDDVDPSILMQQEEEKHKKTLIGKISETTSNVVDKTGKISKTILSKFTKKDSEK